MISVGFEIPEQTIYSNCNCCPSIDHYIIHRRPDMYLLAGRINYNLNRSSISEPSMPSINVEAAIRHRITYLWFQFRSLITKAIVQIGFHSEGDFICANVVAKEIYKACWFSSSFRSVAYWGRLLDSVATNRGRHQSRHQPGLLLLLDKVFAWNWVTLLTWNLGGHFCCPTRTLVEIVEISKPRKLCPWLRFSARLS